MDDLLEKFGTALGQQNSDNGDKTSFDGLYKNWGRVGGQEERRREILDIQKSNRNSQLDSLRGILDLVDAIEENEIYRSQRKVYYRPSIYVAGFHRASPSYSNVLMLSEWMVEKPQDLAQNWFVVPCPKGVRMLVVANRGRTKFYTKFGKFRFERRTALPGGCDKQKNACCVFDGFYQEKTNTLYVLDLLAWTQPMTDGETEFRHYWLESKFAELPGLKVISKKNQVLFSILPKTPCTPEGLNKFMMTYPAFEQNKPTLDGLLFYHRRAHYISGETPLVGWLFPYMVPEVLGSEITVHEDFMKLMPPNYVNQADFIQKFELKYAKKKNRSRNSSINEMETVDDDQANGDSDAKTEIKSPDVMEAEENQDPDNGCAKTDEEGKTLEGDKSTSEHETKDTEVMESEENRDEADKEIDTT